MTNWHNQRLIFKQNVSKSQHTGLVPAVTQKSHVDGVMFIITVKQAYDFKYDHQNTALNFQLYS